MESRCYREIFLGKREQASNGLKIILQRASPVVTNTFRLFDMARSYLSVCVCECACGLLGGLAGGWDSDESHMVDVATMRMGLSSCHG